MKILYLLLLVASITFTSNAQVNRQFKLPAKSAQVSTFLKIKKSGSQVRTSNLRTAATCSYDTIDYVFAKTSGINFLPIINNTENFISIGQYFDCPQPITISGFAFVAIKPDEEDATPVNVTCSIYTATADSTIPIKLGTALETPITSVVVPVDTTGYNDNVFKGIRYAVFPKPVTVNKPFILAITNSSTVDGVILVTNDYDDSTSAGKPRYPDGYQEWMMSMVIRTGVKAFAGYRSDAFGIDGDLIVTPFVKYDIVANFSVSKTTVSVGEEILVTNLNSPIIDNGIYNTSLLQQADSLSHFWDLGDSTDGVPNRGYTSVSGFTTKYSKPGTYTITLNDTIYGYHSWCGDQKSVQITVIGSQGVDSPYDSQNIRLFPNPNDGEFTLTFDQNKQTPYTLTITDLAGSQILQTQTMGGIEEKISLKNQAKGMYLLKLSNDREQIIKQIIVR